MATKKKNTFNIYEFMQKKRKTLVLGVCLVIVLTMVAGLFSQFVLF